MVVPWLHDKSIGTASPDGAVEAGGDTPGHSVALSASYADGAAEAGGDAVAVQQAFGSPSGAAEAGGDGTHIESVAIAADGAAEAGGDPVAITRTIAIDGAAEAGGDALAITQTWAAARIDGAVKAGGDAVPAYLTTRSTAPDGAATAGGDGVTPTRSVTQLPDGAVQAGGDGISITQDKYHSVPGGAVRVGGHTTLSVTKAGAGAGGSSVTFNLGASKHRGPTTQTAILHAVRDHLISQGLFIASTIWVRIDPAAEDKAPAGDQYMVIAPGPKVVNQAWAAGSGVEVDIQVEHIELTLYHRLALDHLQRSTHWTVSRSHGAYGHARNVANALHVCDLMDAAGTILVAEPARIIQLGQPRASTRKSGWGEIPITLEVTYRTNFDSVLV